MHLVDWSHCRTANRFPLRLTMHLVDWSHCRTANRFPLCLTMHLVDWSHCRTARRFPLCLTMHLVDWSHCRTANRFPLCLTMLYSHRCGTVIEGATDPCVSISISRPATMISSVRSPTARSSPTASIST